MIKNGNLRPSLRLISLVLVFTLIACSMFGRFSCFSSAYTDDETFCGKTEHEHTEDCYKKKRVCGLKERPDEESHVHTDACYETTELLVCGQEESNGHTHSDACYKVTPPMLICTLEETEGHTHTDACYEVTPPMLICTLEETEGHTHTDACYEVTPTMLICGQEEDENHTHTADCYSEEVRTLICGQEEYAGHTHTADCYSEEIRTLICGQEECPAHSHTDACYSPEERTLICGLEESDGHQHTKDCYKTEKTLTCGLKESEPVEGHTHTDDCYEVTNKLICELEEHTHTEACLSNPNADLENAAVWESTLPARTGVWRDDVVAIAQSQLGYTESSRNFVLSEDEKTRKGYSRYGAWYGSPYGDWCAMFASFCIYYAGVPRSEFPLASSVSSWMSTLSSMGRYAGSGSYTPLPGDLVFFNEHVGIVERVEDTTLYTIEGNAGNAVRERSYSLTDSRILGYGILPDQDGTSEEEADFPFDDLNSALFGTGKWRYDLHVHRYVQWLL